MGKLCKDCGVKPRYSTVIRCKECHGVKMKEYRQDPIFAKNNRLLSKQWRTDNKAHETSLIKKNQRSIPAGIYGIFNDCKLVYIGQSITPYRRVGNHFSIMACLKQAKIVSNVCYALSIGELQRDNLVFKMLEFIDDKHTRKQREAVLIQRYKPLYNSDMYYHIH